MPRLTKDLNRASAQPKEKSVYEIVRECASRLSGCPEDIAGYDNPLALLNSSTLERIYDGVRRDVGFEAAAGTQSPD